AETEADEFAAKTLTQSNIDTRPLAGFFERIIKQRKAKLDKEKADKNKSSDEKTSAKSTNEEDDSRSILQWISTHPATSDRIKFFNQSKLATTPEILTPLEWQALKNICGPKKEKQKEKQKDKAPAQ
ncbi:MAG: M48 family metalloprotease, partial [Rhizobiales bacterium]|nr:M48 family metalloprotease [Hyphomicrobiales bacterium]